MSETVVKSPQTGTGVRRLIYVVDDEAMLLELASVILEPLGYEVQTFRDPAAALKAFTIAQPKPTLVITDYAMHSMDGLSLVRACRQLEPDQKVLLISGTVGPEICRNGPVTPDCFLGKPYQARQLVELVRSMLAN
jgi:two-component system, cell cycle sensor histidine kinase and response regulator CckA